MVNKVPVGSKGNIVGSCSGVGGTGNDVCDSFKRDGEGRGGNFFSVPAEEPTRSRRERAALPVGAPEPVCDVSELVRAGGFLPPFLDERASLGAELGEGFEKAFHLGGGG